MEASMLKNAENASQHDKVVLDRKAELYRKRRYWVLRRGQDILFSAIALLILWPFLLLVALVIYIDDPHGSPVFKQTRCGRNGKPFQLYKFRSMYMDAEERLEELLDGNEMDGPAFKIKNDPRITRAGHILRRTSIDELPQLWNILKGDMSIVGPRPALLREVEMYDSYQRQRMYVTPGLTCYWQIQPNRNEISFEDWMALDIQYIQERNFWVDWKIIFKTVKAVLTGQGE